MWEFHLIRRFKQVFTNRLLAEPDFNCLLPMLALLYFYVLSNLCINQTIHKKAGTCFVSRSKIMENYFIRTNLGKKIDIGNYATGHVYLVVLLI